ncbi:MAG TPA: hypothetical protein VEQ11_07965 [Chloroflexota bacterium]|nr:hypothetical protein [Chloroflexota bacterium]
MKKARRAWALWWALLVLDSSFFILDSSFAFAHGVSPARSELLRAGPYTLELSFYSEPVRAAQAVAITITPRDRDSSWSVARDLWVTLVAEPGPAVAAPITRPRVVPDDDDADSLAAELRLAAPGPWLIHLSIDGPLGHGEADVAISAAAPSAIPVWLGWAIGLAPLAGLALFGWSQHRWLRSLPAIG